MSNPPPLYLFDNFDLRFETGATPGTYRARVESLAGQATGPYFRLPLEWKQGAFLHESDPTTLETTGRTLFDLIFQGDVAIAFARSKEQAETKGKALRVRLRFQDTPDLAALPWEWLTPHSQNPLSLSPRTPIVHYLDLLDTPKPLPVTLPLRVLVVIAAPPSQPLIDGNQEWEALTAALRPLQDEGLVVVERLPNASFFKLQETLNRNTPYHVLHYIGHSRFNAKTNQGELLLEADDPAHDEAPLAAKDFAQLLADHRTSNSSDSRSFRLAYLNSCQGSVGQEGMVAGGIAHALVQQSLPAVIAMQGYIPNSAAVALAAHFYRALSQGNPVDVALALARQNFRQETEAQQTAWGLPALFLRSDNSYLFALPGQILPDMGVAQLPPAPGDPPYQGLAYYDLHDHARFFGREALTEELVSYLRTNQTLVVVGASGSGKSSLVRAGLLPALLGMSTTVERERLPRDPATWQLHLLTPTAQPLAALAASLTKDEPSVLAAKPLQTDIEADPAALDLYLRRRMSGNPATRILLVIDQFEELFTLCKERQQQERFVETLFYALTQSASLTLILTLRADFYHKCDPFPALRQALEAHQRYIGAMSAGELRRAIESPAQQSKWAFESGLVELLLDDAGNEPGNLPLLSHALHETWKQRSGRTLTFAGYVASGRIQGAIARTADSIFSQLSIQEQTLARKLFIDLTELGEGTQDTRRRVPTARLLTLGSNPETVEALLNSLAQARLISTDKDTSEVAHEALIREWGTLRQWVDEDRAWVRFRRELEEDATQWETLQRDVGSLYGGARLARALAETQGHESDLRPIEREFLAKSQQQETEEARIKQEGEERHRRNILLTRFAWALGALLILAFGLAVVAYQQSVIAGQERQIALNAQATSTINEGLANSAESTALADRDTSIQAQSTAIAGQATAQTARLEAEISKQQVDLLQLASKAQLLLDTDPEQATLLATEAILRHEQINANLPEIEQALRNTLSEVSGVVYYRHPAAIVTIKYSTNNRWVAAGTADGKVLIWDLSISPETPFILDASASPVNLLNFSQNNEQLLIRGDQGNSISIWNLEDRVLENEVVSNFFIMNIAISPDGKWLALCGTDSVELWDIGQSNNSNTILEGLNGGCVDLEFSSNGRWLVAGSNSIPVVAVVWDITTINPIPTTLTGHNGSILKVMFSYDDQFLATASYDGMILLWSVGAWQEPLHTLLHDEQLTAVAFSRDNRYLASGSKDTLIRIWDLQEISNQPLLLSGHQSSITNIVFSPDSSWLATYSSDINSSIEDNTFRLWDTNNFSTPPLIFRGHSKHITALVFSEDNQNVYTGSIDGVVRKWDTYYNKTEPVLLSKSDVSVTTMDVSSSRELVATGSNDGLVSIFSISPSGISRSISLTIPRSVRSLRFSPDNNLLAAGNSIGAIYLWDLSNQYTLSYFLEGDSYTVYDMEFSPDGKWLAIAKENGKVVLLNLESTLITTTILDIYNKPNRFDNIIWDISFSPDSNWLSIAGEDRAVYIYSTNNSEFVSYAELNHQDITSISLFSPDGKLLATGGDGGSVDLWLVEEDFTKLATFNHQAVIFSLDFSPDSQLLAIGLSDGTIYLWDIRNPNRPPQILNGNNSGIVDLAFSPNGEILASSEGDKTGTGFKDITLWDVNDPGNYVINLSGHRGSVLDIAFVQNGQVLISSGIDGSVRQWSAAKELLVQKACNIIERNMTREEWRTYFGDEPYRPTCPQWATPPEE